MGASYSSRRQTLNDTRIASGNSAYLSRQAAPVQQTQSIRSDINLQRDSLQVIRGEAEDVYALQFVVDTSAPCSLSIYYSATCSTAGVTSKRGGAATVMSLPSQLGQLIVQPLREGFRLTDFAPSEFAVQPNDSTFPIVIVLETFKVVIHPDPTSTSKPQVQTSMVSVEAGRGTVRVLKQFINLEGESYLLQEIYGLEARDQSVEVTDDGVASECVVCMEEQREVMVLPCRHMCLCQTCANMLRFQSNKCPICRSFVASLLCVKQKDPPATADTTTPATPAGISPTQIDNPSTTTLPPG